jgi:hypothetical protein
MGNSTIKLFIFLYSDHNIIHDSDGNFEASPTQAILGVVKIMPRLTSTSGPDISCCTRLFRLWRIVEHSVRQILCHIGVTTNEAHFIGKFLLHHPIYFLRRFSILISVSCPSHKCSTSSTDLSTCLPSSRCNPSQLLIVITFLDTRHAYRP